MEIETTPVTLEQRIEFLKQTAANGEINKKSFPWAAVIISFIVGVGICLVVKHYIKKQEEKQITPS